MLRIYPQVIHFNPYLLSGTVTNCIFLASMKRIKLATVAWTFKIGEKD